MRPDPKVEAELEWIETASIPDLKRRWLELYGHEPPKRLSRRFLELAVAYRIQEKAYGGLKRETKDLLRRYAKEIRETGTLSIVKTGPRIKAGTRLVKAWRGQTHVVTVLDKGFLYRDQHFGSLSEIAREITGTRRSGPLFFGLKSERKRAANGVRIEIT